MATVKVGVYRKYHGKIPKDKNGLPLPQSEWPRKRAFRWVVRWFGTNGNRYGKSFDSRKEATEHAKAVQSSVDKGKGDRPKNITLAGFLAEHRKVMKGQVAYSTLKDQLRALQMFANYVGGQILLTKIRPCHAEAFVASRLAEKLSPASVNKDIRTLKSVFNRAIEPRGYLPEGANPFAKIKQRRITDKPPCYVTQEQFHAVFVTTDRLWWKALLALAYTSGIRRSELLNLTWMDIDFQEHNVRVVPKQESDDLLAWEPKDHESRTIPIPPETVQLLANLQAEAHEQNPYVFIPDFRWQHILQQRSEGSWSPDSAIVNNMLRGLKTMCCRAGVNPFTLHDLRRSCITNWARKLSIQVVQHLAGHSNMETTRKHYLSVQQSDLVLARKVQSKLMTSLTHF